MRKRIRNDLLITCEDIDLQTVSHIEFYVKQLAFFGKYTPEVLSAHEMVVRIPFEDAMRLRSGDVELQFAFADQDGVPMASEIERRKVSDFLKEAGYDPV